VSDVLPVLAVGLLTAAVVMTVAALVARAVGRVAVVDVAWGLGFVAIAVTTAVVAQGDAVRRWVVPVLVGMWGLRLAWHIRRRAVGSLKSEGGEDPRYEALLGGPVREVGFAVAVRKVFLVQGAAMWFIALPVQVGAALSVRWWPVAVAGAVLWLVGLIFEAVGDAQLSAYKQDPHRGPVMDRGLWRWTRHPNYFGDACVWWGLWLIGGLATGWLPGLLTVLAPVAMTYFLVFATGARLLERTMMKRPGYPEYAARTSMFVPLPPKRG
jgi:steroid 5-alpha reductase family enzyme